jgi:DNA/RNA endonuclease YhcR with UshA esterase domain
MLRGFAMRLTSMVFALLSLSSLMAMAEEITPITPAEAAKKVNEKVVVQMEVKSSGGNKNQYLNSEEDYKDLKNFTIFIAKDHLDKFKKAGIENPSVHFKGKLLQVTGVVALEQQKPRISVAEPDQIKVITKEKKN